MESLTIEKSIEVFCITARSFPDGVKQAHMDLHGRIAFSPQRKYFGISWHGPDGKIVYKAGASELSAGELNELKLEKHVIKKGTYNVITVSDFMNDIPAIGKAFDTLATHVPIDGDWMAVEWYYNESDVRCMVRVGKSQSNQYTL